MYPFMLQFFRVVPTFYRWVFPLNLMAAIGFTISFFTGFTVEICVRRNSKVRWVYPLICAVMMVLFEVIAQMMQNEQAIIPGILCWFMETALLSAAIGFMIRAAWTALRQR